jgi:hypothetical protein
MGQRRSIRTLRPSTWPVHLAQPRNSNSQRNAGSRNRLALWLLSDALINRAICGVAVGLCDGRSGKVADWIVGIRANPMPSSFVRADLGNSAVALECSGSARPII